MNRSDNAERRSWRPHGWTGTAAALLMVAGCVCLAQWLWGEAPAGAGQRIGVVNLSRVWQGYQRKVYLDGELERLGALKQATYDEKASEVEQLQKKIENLAAGSAQRSAAEQELTEKRVQLDSLGRISRQELATKALEYMDSIYSDIRTAVNDAAEQGGYHLVLKTSDVKGRAKTIQEFQGKLEGQVVLYSSSQVELTDDVLALLNSRFAQGGAGRE